MCIFSWISGTETSCTKLLLAIYVFIGYRISKGLEHVVHGENIFLTLFTCIFRSEFRTLQDVKFNWCEWCGEMWCWMCTMCDVSDERCGMWGVSDMLKCDEMWGVSDVWGEWRVMWCEWCEWWVMWCEMRWCEWWVMWKMWDVGKVWDVSEVSAVRSVMWNVSVVHVRREWKGESEMWDVSDVICEWCGASKMWDVSGVVRCEMWVM